jgi:hypothetical protein
LFIDQINVGVFVLLFGHFRQCPLVKTTLTKLRPSSVEEKAAKMVFVFLLLWLALSQAPAQGQFVHLGNVTFPTTRATSIVVGDVVFFGPLYGEFSNSVDIYNPNTGTPKNFI